jgi:hypothetical protein
MPTRHNLLLLTLVLLLTTLFLVACDEEADCVTGDEEACYYEEEITEDECVTGEEDGCLYEPEWNEEELSEEELGSASDYCYPGELYDPETDECYIECDTEEECLELEEAIYGAIDEFWGEEIDYESFGPPDEDTPALATYNINPDFSLELIAGDPDQGVEPIFLDPDWHREIWLFAHNLLPNDLLRNEVVQFVIFTDGVDETLAYVQPLEEDPEKWLLAIDIADVDAAGSLVNPEFVHTLVHEFAHILTLENDQVPPDYEAIELFAEGSEEISDTQYYCETYYPGEGCALGDSFINLFFQSFWQDIYDEHPQDEEDEEGLADFYAQYEEQFVTDYAATTPAEDIAESFTYFVLHDKPEDPSIASQKVRFFYDFPRLVQMRQQVRRELARLQAEYR